MDSIAETPQTCKLDPTTWAGICPTHQPMSEATDAYQTALHEYVETCDLVLDGALPQDYIELAARRVTDARARLEALQQAERDNITNLHAWIVAGRNEYNRKMAEAVEA